MSTNKKDLIIFSNIIAGMAFVFASCIIRDIHIPTLILLIISCIITGRVES